MAGFEPNDLFNKTDAFGKPEQEPAATPFRQPGANLAAPTVAGVINPGDTGGRSFGFRSGASPRPAPGANLVPPGGTGPQPGFTPTSSSLGGSMVMGKDAGTGVEEIRSAGHPSWQLFQNAGKADQYPQAVAAWRTGEADRGVKMTEGAANRAAELEKARITGEAHVAGATGPFKGPLYEAETAERQRLTKEGAAKTEKDARTKAATDFLHEIIPMAGGVRTPKKNAVGYDLQWPSDPGAIADVNRAHDKFMATGDKAAAMKDYQESKQIRQYEPLFDQAALDILKPGFTMDELSALRQTSPDHYRQVLLKWGPQLQQMRKAQPVRGLGEVLMQGTPGIDPFVQ